MKAKAPNVQKPDIIKIAVHMAKNEIIVFNPLINPLFLT